MKKSIIAALILTSSSTFAQLYSPNGVDPVTNGTTNVGIGTASPTEALDIKGSLRVRGTSSANGSWATALIGTAKIQSSIGSGGASASFIGPGNNEMHMLSDGKVIFKSNNNTVLSLDQNNAHLWGNKMVVQSDGKVGIGTDSPKSKLHITSASSGHTPTNVQGLFVETSGSANGHYVFQTASVGGGKSFSVLNSGRVGIGTTSPSEILDVNGNIHLTGQIMMDGADFRLGLNDGRDKGRNILQRAMVHYTDDKLILNYAGDFEGGTEIHGDKVSINGNLSIGTVTVPEEYVLAAGGKIICEEMTVQLKEEWGDFVFNDGYNLESLEKIEAYINENHHLPRIPSAKEIEENGIELGEMQRLQMIKIEELTLHLIHANKEKKKLYKALESVKDKLAAIEKAISK